MMLQNRSLSSRMLGRARGEVEELSKKYVWSSWREVHN
jgi:hypothetical protein